MAQKLVAPLKFKFLPNPSFYVVSIDRYSARANLKVSILSGRED